MDATAIDFRRERGLVIASATAKRIKKLVADTYLVPSQTHTGTYVVKPSSCTCPDFETRGLKCKHMWAISFARHEVTAPDGSIIVTEAARITYTQNWSAYNRAQTTEKEHVQTLLHSLCSGIVTPPRTGRGRPSLPLSDAVFGMVAKVYGGMSARRSSTDIRQSAKDGHITKAPHYNSVLNYLEKPSMTPLLKVLVEESASPLVAIETKFAADSTGFSTNTYRRWFDAKYGKEMQESLWIKAHAMVGCTTNVITAVEVTDGYANDSPQFPALVNTTAKRFKIAEVSADKAYLSHENLAVVENAGGLPYIPFKSNSQGEGSEPWRRLWHLYSFKRNEFLQKYRSRENSEATFSAVKRLFGGAVRARMQPAMLNEALCKCLAFNLTVLVHSFHDLGIEPAFWGASESPSPTVEDPQ